MPLRGSHIAFRRAAACIVLDRPADAHDGMTERSAYPVDHASRDMALERGGLLACLFGGEPEPAEHEGKDPVPPEKKAGAFLALHSELNSLVGNVDDEPGAGDTFESFRDCRGCYPKMGGEPGGFDKPSLQVQILHVFRLPGREGTNLFHDDKIFFCILSKFFQ